MLPLPDVPKTFRDLVEADLRRAARLIIKIQDEIDWQFRIATPEGDYHLSITMPDGAEERSAMLGRLAVFMMWKRAVVYVLAVETREPDAVYAVGVSASEQPLTAWRGLRALRGHGQLRISRPWSGWARRALRRN